MFISQIILPRGMESAQDGSLEQAHSTELHQILHEQRKAAEQVEDSLLQDDSQTEEAEVRVL